MKRIIVTYLHPNYLRSTKLQLVNPLKSTEIQPNQRKVQLEFHSILGQLILTHQQKDLLTNLPTLMKSIFIKESQQKIHNQNKKYYIGSTPQQHYKSFEKKFEEITPANSKQSQLILLQFYYYVQRDNNYKNLVIFIEHNTIQLLYNKIQQLISKDNCIGQIFMKIIQQILIQMALKTPNQHNAQYIFHQTKNILHTCINIIQKCLINAVSSQFYQSFLDILKIIAYNNEAIKDKTGDNFCNLEKVLLYRFDNNQSILFKLIQIIKLTKNIEIIRIIIEFVWHVFETITNFKTYMRIVTELINIQLPHTVQIVLDKFKLRQYLLQDWKQIKCRQKGYDNIHNALNKLHINEKKFTTKTKTIYKRLLQIKQLFINIKLGKIDYKKYIKTNKNIQRQTVKSIQINKKGKTINLQNLNQENLSKIDEKQILFLQLQCQQFKQQLNTLSKLLQQKQQDINRLEFIIGQYITMGQQQKTNKQLKKQKLLLISTNLQIQLISQKKPNQFMNSIESTSELKPLNELKKIDLPSQNDKNNNKSIDKIQQSAKIEPVSVQFLKKKQALTEQKQPSGHCILPIPSPPPPLTISTLPPPPPPPPLLTLPMPVLSLPNPPLSLPTTTTKQIIQTTKKIQMKTISWQPIDSHTIYNSFWSKINVMSINQSHLQQLFSKQNKSQKIKELKVQPKLNSLLKPDRAKNIQIVLKKLKIDPTYIEQCVTSFNSQMITYQLVQCLLNILPTHTQHQLYKNIQINKNALLPDYYLSVITKIPQYQQRLRAMQLKYEFKMNQQKYFIDINHFITYLKSILNDNFLQLFLQYLLVIGNYFNQTINKKQSSGFKLDCIDKTYTLIAKDHQTSLFQYILQEIQKQLNEATLNNIIQIYEQSQHLVLMNLKYLHEKYTQYQKQCENIEDCLVNIQLPEQQLTNKKMEQQYYNNKITQYLLPFYAQMREQLALMEIKVNEAESIYREVLAYYCQKIDSQKLIEIIKKFRGRVRQFYKKVTKTQKF